MKTSDERREVAAMSDESVCRTCVYGFPEGVGWSCGVMRKLTSAVVVRCEQYAPEYRKRTGDDDDR